MIKKKIMAVMSAAILGASCLTTYPSEVTAADFVANKSRVSVHDPSIVKDPATGTYYVFGSHIEAAKSNDLQSWKTFANGYAAYNNVEFGSLSQNLAKPFAWAGENLEDCEGGFAVWAPDVIWNPEYRNSDGTKGAYMMYFCTSSTYKRSVIAFAVAKNIEGPYTCVDTLIYSGFTANDSYAKSSTKNVNRKYTSTNIDELIARGEVTYNNSWFSNNDFNNQLYPNAIDPNIYYGTDGKMYMSYGSWSGGIFTIEINQQTGLCVHPKTGTTSDGRMVDSYFGTKISGGYGKSGEGPFIEYNEDTGYFYLWVTYGGLTATGGYNMRVFRSKSPTGPFVDPANRNAVLESNTNLDSVGLKVMTNYRFSSLSASYMACGHNSVLKDDDGHWYLVNHTRFDGGTEYHEVRVHSMKFNETGWPVVLPYEYGGETWSDGGYEPQNLAGTYEFINHGNATNGNITKAASITLGTNGTISGAVTGTWNESDSNASASFSIGGVTYKGYFQLQYEERQSSTPVMTFTAVGNNNQTIWGVQTTKWSGNDRTTLKDYSNQNSKIVYNLDSISREKSGITLSNTSLLSGVSYHVENVNSGLFLDLPNGKPVAGSIMQQWQKTGNSQQEWRFVDVGDGYCKIVSMADEQMCVAVENASADDGAAVVLQKYAGATAQQWKLVPDAGSYAIVSRCSDNLACLDVYEWSVDNGGVVKQWNYWGGECQLWKITPAHPAISEGCYTIRSANTGLWIAGEGSRLIQNFDQSVWRLTALENGLYNLVNADGLALTVSGSGIALSAKSDSTSQQFAVWCNVDGSYSIVSTSISEKSAIEADSEIGLADYIGAKTQKFVFEPTQYIPEAVITTTTTLPVTTTTTTVDTTLMGDSNCDGKVSIADVVILSRYVNEEQGIMISKQGRTNSDCDYDGLCTAEDATMILKAIAKLITI